MKPINLDSTAQFKLMIAVALVLIVASVAVAAFGWPKAPSASKFAAQKSAIDAAQAQDQLAVGLYQESIDKMTFPLSEDQVDGQALATVTATVKQRTLKLVALRPQKPVPAMGLLELPYLVAVEGPYSQIVGFVHDLEKPETKIALESVQIASTDGSSDHVTATIMAAAYISAGGTNGK